MLLIPYFLELGKVKCPCLGDLSSFVPVLEQLPSGHYRADCADGLILGSDFGMGLDL